MRPAEEGFTLLEMMVALAVFSLGVLALVNLAGENVRTGGLLESRAFAGVVADNRAVEAVTARPAPALGETRGGEEAAGRAWSWSRKVSATQGGEVLRIDIAVREKGQTQVLSGLTLFRSAR
jgi:general secretion pathway protein I